jgi:ribosomal protein S18 acetylase RimI-like enzyme
LTKIRKARVEDLEAINRLTDEMHVYLADLYGLELSPKELEEEHFEEEELGENIYVAESEENIVIGYISFSKGENEMAGPHYEVEHIVVAEKYRGLNVGRMLFDIVLERARREKLNVTTGTLARNEKALKFYEMLRFKPLTIVLLLDLQKRMLKKQEDYKHCSCSLYGEHR